MVLHFPLLYGQQRGVGEAFLHLRFAAAYIVDESLFCEYRVCSGSYTLHGKSKYHEGVASQPGKMHR